MSVTAKDIVDLEKRLAIALTDEVAKNTMMQTLGMNFQNVIYADSKAIKKVQDGTSSKPFSSLQAAVTAAEKLGSTTRKMILISPGSAFDEHITINDGMMSIIGLGPWTLGDAAGTSFASTTPRNITWNITNLVDGKRPTLRIGALDSGTPTSTHPAYASSCEISGGLTITDSNGYNVSHELHLANVKLKSDFTATDSVGGLSLYFNKCFFDAAIDATVGLLYIANECEFDGLINLTTYGRLAHCEVTAGMTVTQAPSNALPPKGIYGCDLKGVFTGPVGTVLLDAASNYFFNNNGATLAGGATRVLLHDEVIV